MTDEKPEINESYIVETVKRYLEPYQPPDYRLNVIETGLRHSSGRLVGSCCSA